jgi:diguanylate cyclase (GGDEF)-like protein
MKQHSETNTVRFTCDRNGVIRHVVSDNAGLFAGIDLPLHINDLTTASAQKRYHAFLDTLTADGFGLCDSLVLRGRTGVRQFAVFGVCKGDCFHMIALQSSPHITNIFSEFIQMLNEQGVLLRATQKKAAEARSTGSDNVQLLEDYMIINNELSRNKRELAIRHEQLKKAFSDIEELSRTDPLTGACNRRKVIEFLSAEIDRSKRYGTPLSILSLDIDRFKAINDTYGHAAGDDALIAFCRVCRQQLRKTDLFGRTGGEEFVAVLPHAACRDAQISAERIRRHVEQIHITYNNACVRFTVSIGIAVHEAGENTDTLLRRADAALYRAKTAGRNTVSVAEKSPVMPAETPHGHSPEQPAAGHK